jgi:hypothetical protein
VYDGEWISNVKSGFGMYKWTSGNMYTGMWRENRREGAVRESFLVLLFSCFLF